MPSTPIIEDSKPPARSSVPPLPNGRPPAVAEAPPSPPAQRNESASLLGEHKALEPKDGAAAPEAHKAEEPKDTSSKLKDGTAPLEEHTAEEAKDKSSDSVAKAGAAPLETHTAEAPTDKSSDSAVLDGTVPSETQKIEDSKDKSSDSVTNDGGTVPPEANEAETEQVQNSLRPLMTGENPEQRASRKRKLFSLFRSYDTAKFNELAQRAEVQPISDLLNSRKKAATVSLKSQVALGLPSAVALFPSPSAKAPPAPPVSKKLRQLEKETVSGGKEKQKPLRTFSLQFLDCSMAAIARWSAGPAQGNGRSRKKKTTTRHTAVASNFRKCGVCGDWGHYETQCAHIKPVELHRVRPYAPENKRQALKTKKKTEITVESCNDFLVEQRSDPRPVDSSEKGSKRPREEDGVVETAVDNLGIKSSSRHPYFAVAFSEGDAVAWSSRDGTVVAGKVEHVDSVRGTIKARCLYIISSNSSGDTASCADIGMLVTLPGKCVRPAMPVLSQLKTFEAKNKSVPTTPKRRRSKLVNQDGTIRSTTTPLLLYDGTYKKPRGRNPGNMTWCILRGVWKPLAKKK
jgi:hypothetical protein